MLGSIQRCTFERAKDVLDLFQFSDDLSCKIADDTLELVFEHCFGFDARALDESIKG